MYMRINFLLLFIIFWTGQTFAHPHVFIDVQPYFISAKNNKVLLHVKWKLDELTSESIFLDYDENHNLILDINECQNIRRDYVEGYKKYNYFVNILLNKKRKAFHVSNLKIYSKKVKKKLKNVRNSKLSSKNKKSKSNIVFYEFDVEVRTKLRRENSLEVSFYDETFYSVLYPVNKIIEKNGLVMKSNKLKKSECLFKVVF